MTDTTSDIESIDDAPAEISSDAAALLADVLASAPPGRAWSADSLALAALYAAKLARLTALSISEQSDPKNAAEFEDALALGDMIGATPKARALLAEARALFPALASMKFASPTQH